MEYDRVSYSTLYTHAVRGLSTYVYSQRGLGRSGEPDLASRNDVPFLHVRLWSDVFSFLSIFLVFWVDSYSLRTSYDECL